MMIVGFCSYQHLDRHEGNQSKCTTDKRTLNACIIQRFECVD